MKYRLATENDIPGVLSIHRKYHIDTIAESDRADGFVTTLLDADLLVELIHEDGLVIAKKDDILAGFVMSASWEYCSKWPMFRHMIEKLDELEFLGQTLTTEKSYQYGPVCIEKNYRGKGVLEGLFDFARQVMQKKYPIMITFVNTKNPRSVKAHVDKLKMENLKEFEYNNNTYIELAYDTSRPVGESEKLSEVRDWWNKKADGASYNILRSKENIEKILKHPHISFHSTTLDLINQYVGDLSGKDVLVPSSGDNHAAMSFAIYGARVISTDISERQIAHSRAVAHEHGLDMEFKIDNTMTLASIADASCDFVYTSNGVHTWIDDLQSMYKNIYRVLKPSGYCIMYDIHPFIRPFEDHLYGQPRIIKSYRDVVPGNHWRVQDLINTMIDCGFRILRIEELDPEEGQYWDASYGVPISKEKEQRLNNWKTNPMAALPQLISVCIMKP